MKKLYWWAYDHTTEILTMLTFGLIALLIVTCMMGCSISLVGGRHMTVINTFSDANTSDAAMQADSETSDMLKDMLKDITFPGGGDVDVPDVVPVPIPEPEPTPNPEPPVEPPVVGSNSFLWKPVSDPGHGGTLVILTPSELEIVEVYATDGERTTTPGNRANDNRQHWRFASNKPGDAYPPGEVVAVDTTGTRHDWTISNPGEYTPIN